MQMNPRIKFTCAVLFTVLTATATNAQPTAVVPQRAPIDGKVKQVCLASWDPMGNCSPDQPASNYTGYDVAVWRATAGVLGWEEGIDWVFNCTGFSDMISELQKPENVSACDIGVGGITISSAREQLGIEFSYPTYRSSLAIMVPVTSTSPDGWFFIKPFEWDVWLALGLTAAIVPAVAFIIEFLALQGMIMKHDWYRGLKEASWRGIWTVMLYEPFHVTSVSARTVALVFGFCMVILINIYCASLTTFLTVSQLNTDINSVNDLRGKSVGTVSVYKPRLAKYGVSGTALDFQGASSVPDWVAAIRNGSLAATAVDEPFQQFVLATSGCDLRILRDTFEQFDYGIAMRVGTPASEISKISGAVLALQGNGTLTDLRSQYIAVENECGRIGGGNDSAAISFDQMWGLWVILGAAAGLAIIVLGFTMWQNKRNKQRYEAHMRKMAELEKEHAAVDVVGAAKAAINEKSVNGKGSPTAMDGQDASKQQTQSIAAMVEGIRALCVEHEALQKKYNELEKKHARYQGYMDQDGDMVVDEVIGEVPLEINEVEDFASVNSDHDDDLSLARDSLTKLSE